MPEPQPWLETDELSALLDEIVEKYKVDKDRIYVTGLSMGGFGTWALAASSPDRFAALVPICGGGDPNARPGRTRPYSRLGLPRSQRPDRAAVEQSEKMVEALKKAGGNVKFTVYPRSRTRFLDGSLQQS